MESNVKLENDGILVLEGDMINIKGYIKGEKADFSKTVNFEEKLSVKKQMIVEDGGTLQVKGDAFFEKTPVAEDILIKKLGKKQRVRPGFGENPGGRINTGSDTYIVTPVSLAETIINLQKQVSDLQSRISNLERRS